MGVICWSGLSVLHVSKPVPNLPKLRDPALPPHANNPIQVPGRPQVPLSPTFDLPAAQLLGAALGTASPQQRLHLVRSASPQAGDPAVKDEDEREDRDQVGEEEGRRGPPDPGVVRRRQQDAHAEEAAGYEGRETAFLELEDAGMCVSGRMRMKPPQQGRTHPNPSLVSTVFFKMAFASGSSKWWNARLNSLNAFFPSFLYPSSRSAGTFAASTERAS